MLVDALLENRRSCPNVEAVRDPFRALTFAQLVNFSLVMRDVARRETDRAHVGLLLPGGCAFTASLFGILWAGKVAVPLNFLLSAEELREVVRDARLDLVLGTRRLADLSSALGVRTLNLEDLPLRRRILFAHLRSKPAPPGVDPDRMAVLLYTSGTSGACKGVELSTRNLRSNCDALIQFVDLRDSDRFLCVLPPFHVFGLGCNVLLPVVRRLFVHVIPRFSAASVFRAIAESEPTVFMAIPSMYAALLRSKNGAPNAFRGMRLLISGGEPLPASLAEDFQRRFGVELLEGYGMTETSPVGRRKRRRLGRQAACHPAKCRKQGRQAPMSDNTLGPAPQETQAACDSLEVETQ